MPCDTGLAVAVGGFARQTMQLQGVSTGAADLAWLLIPVEPEAHPQTARPAAGEMHDQHLVDSYRQRLVELHNGRTKRDERKGRYFVDGEL